MAEEDSTTLVVDSPMAAVNPDTITSSRVAVVAVGNRRSLRSPTRLQLARPERIDRKV